MADVKWVDYSGALPILLPVHLMRLWHGFYLSAQPGEQSADLLLPEGAFRMCDHFDFAKPRTDYDRACALGATPRVQTISVGSGTGVIFATQLDAVTWWPEKRMIVNGGDLPDLSRLTLVDWSNDLAWATADSRFVLMNACDHGAAPMAGTFFDVRLPSATYTIQSGRYGWLADDPVLILFRFVAGG
jgi:hypothetical protein